MKKIKWACGFLLYLAISAVQACSPVSVIRLSVSIHNDIADMNAGRVIYSTMKPLSVLLPNKEELLCGQPSRPQSELMVWGRMHGTMAQYHTWPTSVPGIGIRVAVAIKKRAASGELRWLPFSTEFPQQTVAPFSPDDIWLKIELVKTAGFVKAGEITFLQPSLLTFKWGEKLSTISLLFNGVMSPDSCHFTQTASQINLEPVDKSRLDQELDSSPMPFSLDLQCSSTELKPELTLFGPVNGKQRDVLTTTYKNNSAQGVGVQILFNGQPLRMGLPVSLESVRHDGNKRVIPLSVRYHKTASVIPGKVETYLTLKLNYL